MALKGIAFLSLRKGSKVVLGINRKDYDAYLLNTSQTYSIESTIAVTTLKSNLEGRLIELISLLDYNYYKRKTRNLGLGFTFIGLLLCWAGYRGNHITNHQFANWALFWTIVLGIVFFVYWKLT